MDKPQIDYPCTWSYRLIGPDEQALRRAVARILGPAEHTLELSRNSRGGKYAALILETVVRSEEQRLQIYGALCKHPAIIMVL